MIAAPVRLRAPSHASKVDNIRQNVKSYLSALRTMPTSRHIRHSVKYYAFILVYLSLGIYVGTIVANLQFWPFSYINPPPPSGLLVRTIDYPSHSLFASSKLIIAYADLELSVNAPLAEELPAQFSATGLLNNSYANITNTVLVGFIGSSWLTRNEKALTISFGTPPLIELKRNDSEKYQYGFPKAISFTGLPEVIVWHTQGDYAPIMVLLFNNGTTISETFPTQTVHVNSGDVARSERYNRVNEAVSIALVAFGIMEGIKILRETDEKHTSHQTTSSDSAIKPKIARKPPNKIKPTK